MVSLRSTVLEKFTEIKKFYHFLSFWWTYQSGNTRIWIGVYHSTARTCLFREFTAPDFFNILFQRWCKVNFAAFEKQSFETFVSSLNKTQVLIRFSSLYFLSLANEIWIFPLLNTTAMIPIKTINHNKKLSHFSTKINFWGQKFSKGKNLSWVVLNMSLNWKHFS